MLVAFNDIKHVIAVTVLPSPGVRVRSKKLETSDQHCPNERTQRLSEPVRTDAAHRPDGPDDSTSNGEQHRGAHSKHEGVHQHSRAHLIQEGQSGIPSDNRRLMDELQSRGVVMPNGDRAVWSGRVTLGEWQQELTLLRFPASRLWPDPATRPDTCHGTIQPLASADVSEAPETPHAAAQSIMEEPPRRVMPAPIAPRPPEPPEPAVGSPEQVAAFGAPPSRVARGTEGSAFTKPVDLGQGFLAWLKQGLISGQFPINTVHARVHRVREGLLLVSPGIFRDYGNAAQAPWASIQKRFQKLKLHHKTPDGFNVWTYSVIGQRRVRELKGIVLDDPERVFGPEVTLPPPNVHVVLVQGKKG